MKLKLLYSLVAFTLLASCDSFLDVKPVGKLIPTQVEEFENILNNENTVNRYFMDNNNGCYLSFLGDNLHLSDNIANYFYNVTHPNIEIYTAYTYKLPYCNPRQAANFWNSGTYRAAGLLNNVIEGVESVRTPESDALANLLISQAKAARAWGYLIMGLMYGPIYDPGKTNDTKTIPYRTSGSPTEPNPPLATTAEVFSYVKKDLEDALEFAPNSVANPSRTSLSATQALMAWYYMFTREFGEMYRYANLAWESALASKGSVDNLIYDYNKFYYEPNSSASPTPGTDIEVVLNMKGQDDLMLMSKHRENLFFRVSPWMTLCYPSEDFLALFDKQKDVRYKLWALKDLGYATMVGNVQHDDGIRINYMKSTKMMINQGITYPELLLMRAEAAARTNNLPGALADLNTLRRYRYVETDGTTDLPGGGAFNADQLLEEILKERRRELPVESFQRFLDLKRYTLDVGKPWCQTTITHTVGSQTYTGTINSEHFILPIANDIIELNPAWGLQKNEAPYSPK